MDLSNVDFSLSQRLVESLLPILLLGQEGAAPAGGAPANGKGDWLSTIFNSNTQLLVPMMLILGMFYLMILLPERKRRAEQEKLLGGLKKNDRVVMTGGIIGVVVMAEKDSKQVTIRIDEKTDAKLTLLRSAIAQVVKEGAEIDPKQAP